MNIGFVTLSILEVLLKQLFWQEHAGRQNRGTNHDRKKWQKVWKSRIQHYTPRSTLHHQDVTIDVVLEKWDPKKGKGDNQLKFMDISPMFGPDVVQLYKTANQAYNPAVQVKSAIDAENVRVLFALELKFMVGCDC